MLQALGYGSLRDAEGNQPFVVGFLLDTMNRLPPPVRKVLAVGIMQGWGMDVEPDSDNKGITVETVKRSGTVHQELKNEIVRRKIDLLVVGELAGVRSRRDEFYDESERALRTVPCTVIVVKDEDRVWSLFEATE